MAASPQYKDPERKASVRGKMVLPSLSVPRNGKPTATVARLARCTTSQQIRGLPGRSRGQLRLEALASPEVRVLDRHLALATGVPHLTPPVRNNSAGGLSHIWLITASAEASMPASARSTKANRDGSPDPSLFMAEGLLSAAALTAKPVGDNHAAACGTGSGCLVNPCHACFSLPPHTLLSAPCQVVKPPPCLYRPCRACATKRGMANLTRRNHSGRTHSRAWLGAQTHRCRGKPHHCSPATARLPVFARQRRNRSCAFRRRRVKTYG